MNRTAGHSSAEKGCQGRTVSPTGRTSSSHRARGSEDDTATNLETYRKEIVETINNDIVLRHGYSEGVIEHSLPDDGDVLKAIEILGTRQEYARIVTEQDTRVNKHRP